MTQAGIAMFLPLTWYMVLSGDVSAMGWFAVHPPMQSLAITAFLLGKSLLFPYHSVHKPDLNPCQASHPSNLRRLHPKSDKPASTPTRPRCSVSSYRLSLSGPPRCGGTSTSMALRTSPLGTANSVWPPSSGWCARDSWYLWRLT